MIARALGWLRGAGSWVLAVAVAVPLLAWLWRAYLRSRQDAAAAERQVYAWRTVAEASARQGALREQALRDLQAQLGEIHRQADADRQRLLALRGTLEDAGALEAWRRAFATEPRDG